MSSNGMDKALESWVLKLFSRILMPLIGSGVVAFAGWAFMSAVAKFDDFSHGIAALESRLAVVQAKVEAGQDRIKDTADRLRVDFDANQKLMLFRIDEMGRRIEDHEHRIGDMERKGFGTRQ